MRLRRTTLVWLAIATPACGVEAVSQLRASRFQITTGRGYEGAIIPALLVPGQLKPRTAGTWTPTPTDVALAERQLVAFLTRARTDPSGVPDVIRTNREVTRDGLPALLMHLSMYKRQYIGLTYDGSKRMLVHGFPEDPAHDWRSSYRMVFDGGCDFWWFDFSLADQRAVTFNCQGNP